MKLRGEWLVLAERVLEDTQTHNMTLVSCVQQVNAFEFPSLHHGFAVAAMYRCIEDVPTIATPVEFRLQRSSTADGEKTIQTYTIDWQPGSVRGRIATNFSVLRLIRPEVLTFRIDHRVDGSRWIRGPETTVDIMALEMSAEDRKAFSAQLKALGLVRD